MIIEEAVYLQHFGKKGMKWRKGRHPRSAAEESRRKAAFGPKGKARMKAVAGTAVAVGAVAATEILAHHGRKKFFDAIGG